MKIIKSTLSGTSLAFLLGGVLSIPTIAPAQSQPTNTLSITAYGASTSSADNTTAMQNCINAAHTAGKGVWIPAGTWTNTGSLTGTGILIAGAGKTSSVIYRNQNSTSTTATQIGLYSCTVQDIGLDGNGTSRGVNASYGINMKGVGWLVQRVQIHHSDAGLWMSGTSGTVDSCTMLQTFADGININNSGTDANHAGSNLTVQNSSQNGAGDDGFAINSQGLTEGWTNMLNPKVLNCTSLNDAIANGIRCAGGSNSLVSGCLVSNVVIEHGINVSSYGADGYAPTNALITQNEVIGGGSGSQSASIISGDARTKAQISNNLLINSSHAGFQIGDASYPNGGSVTFGPNNVIVHPAGAGIAIQSGVVGAGIFYTNSVLNLNSGQPAFTNGSSTYTTTLKDNNWQGLDNGTYKIVNLNSGLALDAVAQGTTNGTHIDQYTYNGGGNQLWAVTNIGSGQYQIKGVQSGLVLDVKGQSLVNGALIQLYANNSGANQKWTITPSAGTIQGVQSSLYMEVTNSSLSAGALVDQWSSTGGQNQQWTFQSP